MVDVIPMVDISVGDRIDSQFLVKKKLSDGSSGPVFLVQSLKEPKLRAAMKVEPNMKDKDNEILKMEVYVLRKLQGSSHVCRLIMAGKLDDFSFCIMSLLGRDICDIRRRLPGRKISLPNTLKIGWQSIRAIQDMHEAGFVHRDIKPTNFAIGYTQRNVIFLFDFGLVRQIFLKAADGKYKLRQPRSRTTFHGTVRYCSINVHFNKEHGRHDDLISFLTYLKVVHNSYNFSGLLYTLVECLTSTLPWKGLSRKESGKLKENVSDNELFKDCPLIFAHINAYLQWLTYYDTPNYGMIRDKFVEEASLRGVKLKEPFEWNQTEITDDERVVRQKSEKESNEEDKKNDEEVNEGSTDESVPYELQKGEG